jgi:hypothetical protein
VCAVLAYSAFQALDVATSSPRFPITHKPTYFGTYQFIIGSGNVLQNGTAYSYVVLNATSLKAGDRFGVYPALNAALTGKGIDESNFTVWVTYLGSSFGADPYWINFSVAIPALGFAANSSQLGVEGTSMRSAAPLPGEGNAQFFSQVSGVVNEYGAFEYFFYVGNSSTPAPQLAHGPPH